MRSTFPPASHLLRARPPSPVPTADAQTGPNGLGQFLRTFDLAPADGAAQRDLARALIESRRPQGVPRLAFSRKGYALWVRPNGDPVLAAPGTTGPGALIRVEGSRVQLEKTQVVRRRDPLWTLAARAPGRDPLEGSVDAWRRTLNTCPQLVGPELFEVETAGEERALVVGTKPRRPAGAPWSAVSAAPGAVRVELARDLLQAVRVVSQAGLAGLTETPTLGEGPESPVILRTDGDRPRLALDCDPLLVKTFQGASPDTDGERRWVAAGVAKLAEGSEPHVAAALEATRRGLENKQLSLSAAPEFLELQVRGEGSLLDTLTSHGLSLERATELLSVRASWNVEGGLYSEPEPVHVSKGQGGDLTYRIFDDGSSMVQLGRLLGTGTYRHAKAVLWIPPQGSEAYSACKVTAPIGDQGLELGYMRVDGPPYALHQVPTARLEREDLLTNQLHAAGAQHVLLPLTRYQRPMAHGSYDVRVMPRYEDTLWEREHALRSASPAVRFSALLPVLRDAALGLAEIHQTGHRHGDVKPENIGIAGGRGYLTDLNLARPKDAPAFSGTFDYFTPEQQAFWAQWQSGIRGLPPAPSSEKDDVHALGVILLEVWRGETPQLGSRYPLHRVEFYAKSLRADLDVEIGAVSDPDVRRAIRAATRVRPEDRVDARTLATTLSGLIDGARTAAAHAAGPSSHP